MGRKKQNEENKKSYLITIRLNKRSMVRLEAISKYSGISKGELIRSALNEYLAKEDKK